MRCEITRKIHEHFPQIKADRSGTGAHLVDQGDTWRAFIGPLAGGIFIGLIAFFFGSSLDLRLGLVLVTIVGAVTAYFCYRRWRVLQALHPGELFIQQWPLRRNEPVRIRYLRLVKTIASVRSIRARLQCVESATYQQGTDTHTVTETRFETILESVQQRTDPDRIEIDWALQIPADQPPSLDVYRNSVQWAVVVEITFQEIPEDDSSFPLLVGPEVLA